MIGSPKRASIAFTAPGSEYVLKVIRDRPTDGYKWDTFQGVEAVLDKYKRVHEINRTGSMLDNIAAVLVHEGGHGKDYYSGRFPSAHSTDNMACLVAGRAGGLHPGLHIPAPGAQTLTNTRPMISASVVTISK